MRNPAFAQEYLEERSRIDVAEPVYRHLSIKLCLENQTCENFLSNMAFS